MFDRFPKIQYQLNGNTLEFTDIFKFVKVDTSNFNNFQTIFNSQRKRPDQLSYDLFGSSNFYWSLFLLNNVKNPFRDWNQTEESIIKQNKEENNSYVFQFANNSKYLPTNSTPFPSNSLDSYEGVSFSDIRQNDVLIYESGGGPLRLKVFGSGVLSGSSCGFPHFGQSYIPNEFSNRNNIKLISAGGNFSSCLDTDGRIWGWGENLGLTGFLNNNSLYYTPDSGYETLDTTNKIVSSKDKDWLCWGSGCSAGVYPITETKSIFKTAWTKGTSFSGVILFNDNSIKLYGGITSTSVSHGSEQYLDISCSSHYCIGINSSSVPRIFAHTGKFEDISSIPTVSLVSCGKDHCVFIGTDGSLYYSGKQNDNRINLPTNSWSKISAGLSFSAGLDTNGQFYAAGSFLTNGGRCSGTTVYTEIDSITGRYDQIVSGDNHIMLLGTGDVTRYFGVVYDIDENYNRIFVRNYDAPNKEVLNLDDASGSFVAVYRRNNLISSIQHQLLSVDTFLNTTQYIRDVNNKIIDVSANNGTLWKSVFIGSYKNHENENNFITPIKIQKESINIKNNINYVSNELVYAIENELNKLVEITDKIEIKLSDL